MRGEENERVAARKNPRFGWILGKLGLRAAGNGPRGRWFGPPVGDSTAANKAFACKLEAVRHLFRPDRASNCLIVLLCQSEIQEVRKPSNGLDCRDPPREVME